LQHIKCPIHLVHSGGDIAYPLEYVEELRDALQGAGLDVRLSQVQDAAHFGCVTHPEPYVFLYYTHDWFLTFYRVNDLFQDWVIQNTKAQVPPAKASVKSPFEACLLKAGYVPDESNDSEDDMFSMVS